jgi:hypothetical protein
MIIKPAFLELNSKEECLRAWIDGKDFRMVGSGRYCSIRDLEYMQAEFETVEIYWFNKAKKAYQSIQVWCNPMHGIVATTKVDMA